MAAATFSIIFDGYWLDIDKGSIPAKSGVYCVYSCKYDKKTDNVNIIKLIYIGESKNVNKRHADGHEKYNDWKAHLNAGEVLCYSFGAVPEANRDRCEAALISKHDPPGNTEYVDSFPFYKTTLTLSGKSLCLNTNFTVKRT